MIMKKANLPALQVRERGMCRLAVLFFLPFLFFSCDGNQTLADVSEEDSLCIDTVATLDDVELADTIAVTDSLMQDTL